MNERVCVHGIGYIGLPTASVLAQQGYEVVGYDIDENVRERVKNRKFDFREIGLEELVTDALNSGRLRISETIEPAEYHLICVPTPLGEDNNPDLTAIKDAVNNIAGTLRATDVVITESTVPPGTSVDLIQPILAKKMPNDTVGLVYCPETVLPGNILTELRENDRILGATTERARQRATELYASFCEGEIYQTDPTTAEFVKLVQNTSRDIDIAFANQVARLAHTYDVNSREIVALANTHPRVEMLSPGPGVGGHCLPVDPWFLMEEEMNPSLIATARKVNEQMPRYVVSVLEETLGDLAGRKIALLGVAYKANVSDARNSPALRIAEELRGVSGDAKQVPDIALTDPYVSTQLYNLQSTQDALDGADAAVIVTAHDKYTRLEATQVATWMDGNVVIDTRNILDRNAFEKMGFSFHII
jgi:UDP-N-acetyl-D-mannosaminuronic acid dehydrogenase